MRPEDEIDSAVTDALWRRERAKVLPDQTSVDLPSEGSTADPKAVSQRLEGDFDFQVDLTYDDAQYLSLMEAELRRLDGHGMLDGLALLTDDAEYFDDVDIAQQASGLYRSSCDPSEPEDCIPRSLYVAPEEIIGEEPRERDPRPGYFSTEKNFGSVWHELGHHRVRNVDGAGPFDALDWGKDTIEAYAEEEDRFDNRDDLDQQVAETVSEYATEGGMEFIAEVHAGKIAGETYPEWIEGLYSELNGPPVPEGARDPSTAFETMAVSQSDHGTLDWITDQLRGYEGTTVSQKETLDAISSVDFRFDRFTLDRFTNTSNFVFGSMGLHYHGGLLRLPRVPKSEMSSEEIESEIHAAVPGFLHEIIEVRVVPEVSLDDDYHYPHVEILDLGSVRDSFEVVKAIDRGYRADEGHIEGHIEGKTSGGGSFEDRWRDVTELDVMEDEDFEVELRAETFLQENTAVGRVSFAVLRPEDIRQYGFRLKELDDAYDLSGIDEFGDTGDIGAFSNPGETVGYFVHDAGINNDEIQVIAHSTSINPPRGIGIDPDDWLVVNDRYQTVVHEVAHYLHFREFQKAEESPREAWDRYAGRLTESEEVALNVYVSDYATTNPFEAVAEIATGLMYGREFPDEVMDTYESHLGPPVEELGIEPVPYGEEPEDVTVLNQSPAETNPWLSEAEIVYDAFERWAFGGGMEGPAGPPGVGVGAQADHEGAVADIPPGPAKAAADTVVEHARDWAEDIEVDTFGGRVLVEFHPTGWPTPGKEWHDNPSSISIAEDGSLADAIFRYGHVPGKDWSSELLDAGQRIVDDMGQLDGTHISYSLGDFKDEVRPHLKFDGWQFTDETGDVNWDDVMDYAEEFGNRIKQEYDFGGVDAAVSDVPPGRGKLTVDTLTDTLGPLTTDLDVEPLGPNILLDFRLDVPGNVGLGSAGEGNLFRSSLKVSQESGEVKQGELRVGAWNAHGTLAEFEGEKSRLKGAIDRAVPEGDPNPYFWHLGDPEMLGMVRPHVTWRADLSAEEAARFIENIVEEVESEFSRELPDSMVAPAEAQDSFGEWPWARGKSGLKACEEEMEGEVDNQYAFCRAWANEAGIDALIGDPEDIPYLPPGEEPPEPLRKAAEDGIVQGINRKLFFTTYPPDDLGLWTGPSVPVAESPQAYGDYGATVRMSVEDFRDLQTYIGTTVAPAKYGGDPPTEAEFWTTNPERVESIEAVLRGDEEPKEIYGGVPMPYVEIGKDGSLIGTQEGRHRTVAAENVGLDTIPVRFKFNTSKGGEGASTSSMNVERTIENAINEAVNDAIGDVGVWKLSDDTTTRIGGETYTRATWKWEDESQFGDTWAVSAGPSTDRPDTTRIVSLGNFDMLESVGLYREPVETAKPFEFARRFMELHEGGVDRDYFNGDVTNPGDPIHEDVKRIWEDLH